MHESSFSARGWILLGMLLLTIGLFAAFVITRSDGDAPPPESASESGAAEPSGAAEEPEGAAAAEQPQRSMAELLPLEEAAFDAALEAAVRHGAAYGTIEAGETPAAYIARLSGTATTAYAATLETSLQTTPPTEPLRESGRDYEGTAEVLQASSIGTESVTFRMALGARPAGGGAAAEEIGEYLVTASREGRSWRVSGVLDARSLEMDEGAP
ncbi:hypothetical protein [Marinitenerispora sediminis]|uniref:Uncharacterized protein n=1 Tax=Marinitenerispora sediminis TaxID=1931232 RepID=A0A368T6E3_9ACTN|nr:hypothetical protein [Marinitenerispora sediminis]RCV53237.1 hypothetical protein DEF28_10900 [Marinitenerispora sediminis]RCV54936.1 hypothetical protein DEF23_15045 [Marinitenerispora sediminis]RCV59059.1 hypothetical protein DEF24_11180 [Marinitenerispora sediminis]